VGVAGASRVVADAIAFAAFADKAIAVVLRFDFPFTKV
jgi:hypothetical protein